jgi:hypothetical protein
MKSTILVAGASGQTVFGPFLLERHMTAQLFLTFLVFVVVAVIGISAAYLPRRTTFAIIAGLAIWLVYVGLFSALGYMRDASLRPPGIVWLAGPVLLFVVFVVRSNIGAV